MAGTASIQRATESDLEALRAIYNQGIEDRCATLETNAKSADDIADWWAEHDDRYVVLVARDGTTTIGWASLNRFSHRCAHAAIADLSVYIARSHRGRGIGALLLAELESRAREAGFHKIVLHALEENERGKRLYCKAGFTEVGVFREHGTLDGRFIDVVAMERLLHSP